MRSTNRRQVTQSIAFLLASLILLSSSGCFWKGEKVISLIRVKTDDLNSENAEVTLATHAELITSPFVIRAALRDPRVAELEVIRSKDNPTCWLQEQLEVTRSENSEIVEVALRDLREEDAKAIVDGVVTAFLEEVSASMHREMFMRLEVFRTARKELANELRELTAKIGTLEIECGVVETPRSRLRRELQMERIGQLQRRILELEQQQIDLLIAMELQKQEDLDLYNDDGEQSPSDELSDVATRYKTISNILVEQRTLLENATEEMLSNLPEPLELAPSSLIMFQHDREAMRKQYDDVVAKAAEIERELARPLRISRVQPAILAGSEGYDCKEAGLSSL